MSPKTIEQMHNEKQTRIAEAIKKKDIRQSKTEISIGFRWAVNVAIAFLPEELKGTKKGFRAVKKWYEEFESWDREHMLENMPIEPVKLGREDFIQAKANAPAEQAKQEVANEIPPDDTNFGDEAVTTLPTEEIQSPKDEPNFD